MFHRVADASKVALVALVDRLRDRGFTLLDIQWVTPHLGQFGAIEIPASRTCAACTTRSAGTAASVHAALRAPCPWRRTRSEVFMPAVTVRVGVSLIVLGIVGYLASGMVSPTALIPAAFGVVLTGLGALGRAEGHRPTMMHFAMLVGLLGVLGSAGGLRFPALASGRAARPAAVIAQAAMAVLLIWYLTMGVRSFVEARRNR